MTRLKDEEILSYINSALKDEYDKFINPYALKVMLLEYRLYHKIHEKELKDKGTFYEAGLIMCLIYKHKIRNSRLVDHYLSTGVTKEKKNANFAVEVALKICEDTVKFKNVDFDTISLDAKRGMQEAIFNNNAPIHLKCSCAKALLISYYDLAEIRSNYAFKNDSEKKLVKEVI